MPDSTPMDNLKDQRLKHLNTMLSYCQIFQEGPIQSQAFENLASRIGERIGNIDTKGSLVHFARDKDLDDGYLKSLDNLKAHWQRLKYMPLSPDVLDMWIKAMNTLPDQQSFSNDGKIQHDYEIARHLRERVELYNSYMENYPEDLRLKSPYDFSNPPYDIVKSMFDEKEPFNHPQRFKQDKEEFVEEVTAFNSPDPNSAVEKQMSPKLKQLIDKFNRQFEFVYGPNCSKINPKEEELSKTAIEDCIKKNELGSANEQKQSKRDGQDNSIIDKFLESYKKEYYTKGKILSQDSIVKKLCNTYLEKLMEHKQTFSKEVTEQNKQTSTVFKKDLTEPQKVLLDLREQLLEQKKRFDKVIKNTPSILRKVGLRKRTQEKSDLFGELLKELNKRGEQEIKASISDSLPDKDFYTWSEEFTEKLETAVNMKRWRGNPFSNTRSLKQLHDVIDDLKKVGNDSRDRLVFLEANPDSSKTPSNKR